MPTSLTINRDELAQAIVELNSMSRCEGIIMTNSGEIRVGNQGEEGCLCMLITAPTLARQLTAAGLSCYTAKELDQWAESYELAPLQAILDAALSQRD